MGEQVGCEMGEHKLPKQIRIALDWAFDLRLEGEQDRLIAALKPHVTTWVTAEMPVIRKQLQRARRVGMQASMMTRVVSVERVWMFNALTHNRDLGTDVIAMVAANKDAIDKMRRCFLQAAEDRMGPGSPAI